MTSKQEQFIQDLVQFYRNKGISSANSSQFVARINGKNIDLHELYSHVLEYGGSYKVNQANLWEEIYFKLFKTSYIGANFAVALRQIFNRYLLQYEKSYSSNANNEQWNEEDEDENAIFHNSHSNSSASSSHHHHLNQAIHLRDFHNVTEENGEVHNDSKLYCSLLSGLPNELNFAFNVATILTNCQRFNWTNDYKFINVLIESVKSYCCICDYIIEELNFGSDTINEEDEILKLEKVIASSFVNNTNYFDITNNDSIKTDHFGLTNLKKKNNINFVERRCHCYLKFWHQLCLNEDLLNIIFNDSFDEINFNNSFYKDVSHRLFQKVERKIALIADIIRNISFTYDQNNKNKVKMTPLLKFLTLLFFSDNVKYVNISLDILSNIAPILSYSLSKPHENQYVCLLEILFKKLTNIALTSFNIHETTKSFEIMARYLSSTNNEANILLEKFLQKEKMYERITQLLTCHFDIALVLALLEFCLFLSECRPMFLINNDNRIFLKILINLLNCHAPQYFTTGALEKIKVIDNKPKEEIVKKEITNNVVQSIPQQPIASTITNQIINKPTITLSNPIQVNLNALDNESFAINWLKATYEERRMINGVLKVNDIYAEYVKYCCRNSRRNVIASQSFNYLLKRCFPTCNINSAALVEGLVLKSTSTINDELVIKSNISSTPQNATSQMSPILKAHLSTPPKTQVNQNDTTVKNVVPTNTPTNASTLIKSLLANKLRNNQQSAAQNNTTQILISNDVSKPPELNIQNNNTNNIIIANNPQTSFSLTPIISNNIIVPSSQTPNQPLPGSSQIFLVRTIITNQGNNSQPVRLLVPATMIHQQRLPVPTTINGVSTNQLQTQLAQNVIQTGQIIQAQQITSQPSIVNSNPIPVIVSTPAKNQVPMKNSIANSSPLLNVLLDKGKLPDFPAQQPPPPPQTQITSVVPSPSTKMLIFNTKPNNGSTVSLTNSISTPVIVTSNVNTENSITTNTMPVFANPVINGDIKTSLKINNSIKHTLDNLSIPELNKRLKQSKQSQENTSLVCTKPDDQKIVNNSIVTSQIPSTINNTITNQLTNQNTTEIVNQRPDNTNLEYECQWNNCQSKFSRPSDVFYHVHAEHIMTASSPNITSCLWGGAEGKGPGCLAKRPKLSLLTHLQDFHCNATILKQESQRKKQLALLGSSSIVLPAPPAHPGYAQNAAIVAIRRHSNKTMQIPSEPVTPLTPLTVSIRLTSALILRNLAKKSQFVKRSLEVFESKLCEISSAEGRDESRTIAQCLGFLNDNR